MMPARSAISDTFPAQVSIIPLPPGPLPLLPARPSAAPLLSLPPGSARLTRVRVIWTPSVIAIFRDNPLPSEPPLRVLAAVPVPSPASPPSATPTALPTRNSDAQVIAGGYLISWSRDSGCGCGSRLRAFNPYRDPLTLFPPPVDAPVIPEELT